MTTLVLTLVATAAGFIDAIAGGGGLLTLPALLMAGLPPSQAIATNKLQGTFGVASASYRYWRAGELDPRALLPAIYATAAGAAAGALAIAHLDPSFLRPMMPYALLAAAGYFALAPYLRDHTSRRVLSVAGFAVGLAAPIGFYDGFFGPGAGSLYMLAFLAFAGANVISATAQTKALNFTSNIVSLAVFLIAGEVNFAVGLPMALGQAIGAGAGAHVALRHGAWLIRPLLVATTCAVAFRLLWTG